MTGHGPIQLKSTGVVNLRETIELRNWSVESGPEVYYVADIMWDRIEVALKEVNIASAAAQLRRGSEEFFGMVCDALQVPVTLQIERSVGARRPPIAGDGKLSWG